MTRTETAAILARSVAGLIGFILLAALALAGAATAIFAIGAHGDFSIPGLADALGLPALRDEVGQLLARLEGEGSVAIVTLLAGVGTIALGLLIAVGALLPRRQRLLLVESGDDGKLAARRRPLEQAAGRLAQRGTGLLVDRVRVYPNRRGTGGRLELEARRAEGLSAETARERAEEALTPLSEAGLLTRVRSRPFAEVK